MGKDYKEKILLILIIITAILAFGCRQEEVNLENIKYVNPFIGTGGVGNTFPGAALPFGMVQLNPSTGFIRNKGYAYSSFANNRESETILGFTQTLTSGTGTGHVAKYGNILLMPTVGALKVEPGTQTHPEGGYRSRFSHDFEEANPGYYKVLLQDYDITAELTVTERVGIHKYTFPKTEQGNIIIDITLEDSSLHKDAFIEIVDNNKIQGYTTVIGTSTRKPMTWYFFAEFSKPFKSYGAFANSEITENQKQARGINGVGAFLTYSVNENEEIIAKVGVSFTGMEGARKNLMHEAKDWKFEDFKGNAENIWKEKLNKFQVRGGTTNNKIKFYTALYHSMLFPRTFSDADGSYYSHFTDSIYGNPGFTYYVDFSLWDTYRTTHPLFTIIEPKRQIDMIKTFLAMYDQGGRIPNQVTYRNFYSHEMIGDHGSTTIIDSYVKGLRDFDIQKAYEGMIKNAFIPGPPDRSRVGIEEYIKYGYIPVETGIRETVSKVLEDSHTDWALAQMSKELGKMDDYSLLMKRASNYQNLFDKTIGFYRPKFADGRWLPFCERRPPQIIKVGEHSYYDCWNPFWIGVSPHRHFTESNAWQYLFYPQHDIHGLIELMGGKETFTKRLDGLFHRSSSNEGPLYSVTGAIGQYVHGNQPSHHVAYLYNYAGVPWKTQERIRGIIDTFYGTDEWGLPGNEDMGEQSAWLIFSSCGFYPITPGQAIYTLSSPIFENIIINLDNYYKNRKFIINAKNSSFDNKYIQSAKLNGKPLNRTWITHEEIINGGTLEFEMGPKPNFEWGTLQQMAPPSMSNNFKNQH